MQPTGRRAGGVGDRDADGGESQAGADVRVLVATRNPGKLREYLWLLSDLNLELVSLDQVGIGSSVAETGQTFAENAILKARAYAQESGLVTLADDSGLEVDALHGQPGILSARFGGPSLDDRQRLELLLSRLAGVAWERRTARFRAAVALARPQGGEQVFEGTCEGFIADAPRGSHGFGYDPVFYLPSYGRTVAELGEDVKNQISHRTQAVRRARGALAQLVAGECQPATSD